MKRGSIIWLLGILFLLIIGTGVLSCGKEEPTPFDVAKFYQAILDQDENEVRRYIRNYKHIARYLYDWEFKGTAAQMAANVGNNEIFMMVVEAGSNIYIWVDDDGANILIDAIVGNNPEIFRYLLAEGLDPYFVTDTGLNIFHFLVLYYSPQVAPELLPFAERMVNKPADVGFTPLSLAVYIRDNDAINFLINQAGASVDQFFTEGLFEDYITLVYGFNNDLLENLLGYLNVPITFVDSNNFSLLHGAAYYANVDAVTMLAPYIADVNLQLLDGGETPLHLALEQADQNRWENETIEMVRYTGDINNLEYEPYQINIESDTLERLLLALVEAGVDPAIPDNQGRLPIDWYREIRDNPDPKVLEALSSR